MDERELRLIYLSGFAKLKERTNRIIQLVSQKMPDLYHLMVPYTIITELNRRKCRSFPLWMASKSNE